MDRTVQYGNHYNYFLLPPCSHLGWDPYVDHYQRDFPSLFLCHYPLAAETAAQFSEDTMEEHPSHFPTSPPHLLHWLHQKLREKQVSGRVSPPSKTASDCES